MKDAKYTLHEHLAHPLMCADGARLLKDTIAFGGTARGLYFETVNPSYLTFLLDVVNSKIIRFDGNTHAQRRYRFPIYREVLKELGLPSVLVSCFLGMAKSSEKVATALFWLQAGYFEMRRGNIRVQWWNGVSMEIRQLMETHLYLSDFLSDEPGL